MWEQWEPHLIWMDMKMPIMDGREAAQRIKATPKGKNTVIIALTAGAFEHDQAVALSAGCDGFVRKPFREEEILEVLAQHLGVHYIYADEAEEDLLRPEQVQLEPGRASQDVLTPARLTALPPALVMALQQATIEGRFAEMLAIVERIREHDEPLAGKLMELIEDFAYDQLLAFIERAGEQI